jgi:hypothetical protein
LPPQDWQQPKWEKQVIEELKDFKCELRTLAAYVFPNAMETISTILLSQKWHQSSGLKWINSWGR